MHSRYTATCNLLLSASLKDVPCHNFVVVVRDSGIGDAFALKIAKALLKEFLTFWEKADLTILLKSATVESLYKDLHLSISDKGEYNKETKDGAPSVAICTVQHLYRLLQKEVGAET